MHAITLSCVLFVWMQTLTVVKSEDCTLQDFKNDQSLYDSNFDTSDLLPSYSSGKQVRVGCNIGYSGYFKLICDNGKWTNRGTKCQAKSCGHPGEAQFADFQLAKDTDYVFGSQVVYTCHKGYQMVSRINYRNCMAEGWDGFVPVCEAQQCPFKPVDNNVQVNGDLSDATYGNVIRFSCKNIKEILEGQTEIYCDEKGEWSDAPPKCKEIKCTAPVIENGNVRGTIEEYKENEILNFECNRKYKPSNERDSRCIKQGNSKAGWSPTPQCEPVTCKLQLPPLEGTRYEPANRNVFSPDDTVTVTCPRKFWIINIGESSAVTTCKEDGEWSIDPVCREVTCIREKPQRQHVNYWQAGSWGTKKLDDTVSYTCNNGYMETNDRATCTRDGWTPKPLCKAITCDRRDVENADIVSRYAEQQTYNFGDKVEYECRYGYKGDFILTCMKGGWNANPHCTEITCNRKRYQEADIVGPAKSTYKYNDQVEYNCKTGYTGRFTITCGEEGWIGSQQCKGCQKRHIRNGFMVGPYNETLYYTCYEGYKLSTKPWWGATKCDFEGFEENPCIGNSECGKKPEIPNGKVDGSGNIICDKGYEAALDRLSCSEGQWDLNGILPKKICTHIAVPCKPPPQVENAVVLSLYQKEYLSGSELTYQCCDEGDVTIRCENGEWGRMNLECTCRS